MGVFDSGLGGLTVVRELWRGLGGEDIVYLGDTARVPYGIKSLATVRRFALEDAAFLLSFGPKVIVAACNSASAAGLDEVRSRCGVPVVDVIGPGAAAAVAATDGPIAVIGTEATIASGAYQRAVKALDPRRRVAAVACPLLVPIVEEGRPEDDPIVINVLCDYLGGLQRRRVGALILGCTHYPLLAGAIAKLMGPDVALVNSGQAAAERVAGLLADGGLANPAGDGGTLRCFTTDDVDRFTRLAVRFGGRRPDSVERIGTDELVHPPQPATEAR
jgi:glutamate racemase